MLFLAANTKHVVAVTSHHVVHFPSWWLLAT